MNMYLTVKQGGEVLGYLRLHVLGRDGSAERLTLLGGGRLPRFLVGPDRLRNQEGHVELHVQSPPRTQGVAVLRRSYKEYIYRGCSAAGLLKKNVRFIDFIP